MLMVEKGMDPVLEPTKRERNPNAPLKIGVMCIGTSLGVISGFLLSHIGLELYFGIPSFIFLFVGLGLVWFYTHIQKKKANN